MKYVIESTDMGFHFEILNVYSQFSYLAVDNTYAVYMPEDLGKEFPVAIAKVKLKNDDKESFHIFWNEGKSSQFCGSLEGLEEGIQKTFNDIYGPDHNYATQLE